MAILADDLVEGVKTRVTLASSQVLLDDEKILKFADDVIKSKIIPVLEGVNQDYLVTSTDIDIEDGVSDYDIPYRAIGRALREIKIKNASDDTNKRNLALVGIEDSHLYATRTSTIGFYFKGDRLRLVPDVPSTLTTDLQLEVFYRLPPNKLVLVSDVATVVSATTTIVTVDAVPSTFTTSTPLDFIQGQSGNRIYDIDISPSGVGSTTITFTSGDIPTDLQAGDYIALAGESPVLNFVPNEASPYIESCVAKRCLKAIGDFEGAKELDDDISAEKTAFLQLIEPRIDGEPTIIINRSGLVRGNKFSLRRWYYGQ